MSKNNLNKYKKSSSKLKQKLAKENRTAPAKVAFPYVRTFIMLFIIILVIGIFSKKNSVSNEDTPTIFSYEEKPANFKITKNIPQDLQVNDKASFIQESPFKSLNDAKKRQQELVKEGYPLELNNQYGITLRLIPSGKFLMGSKPIEKGRVETETLHEAIISKPFYVSKYEISNKTWKEVMGYLPKNRAKDNDDNYPISAITHKEVQEFITKLNQKLNVPSGTYKIISEKEWEYVCRAGSDKRFNFIDEKAINSYIHFDSRAPEAIGLKAPNIWGIYNMHGNVAEFTRDKFSFYLMKDDEFFYPDVPILYNKEYKFIKNIDEKNNKAFIAYFKKHYKVYVGKKSLNKNIYFHDSNYNGFYDYNEALWCNNSNTKEFNQQCKILHTNDHFEKIIADKKHNQLYISNDNIYFIDSNNNNLYDEGEFIWLKNLKDRDRKDYIYRGGNWHSELSYCRSAARYSLNNVSASNLIGFRIIRTIDDFELE